MKTPNLTADYRDINNLLYLSYLLWEIKKYSGSTGPFDHLPDALKGIHKAFNSSMWSSQQQTADMEQGAKAGSLQAVTAFMCSQPEFAGAARQTAFPTTLVGARKLQNL